MKPFIKENRESIILEINDLTNGDISLEKQYIDKYLYANSINLNLSEDLYRIMKWSSFIDDLKNKKLTFRRISSWEDPFENFILKSKVFYRGKYGKISDTFFGSCWSLKSDCDGLWRSLKSNKRNCVVKVKTNAKKLFTSIYNINDRSHDRSYFIGKIRYLSEISIANIFKKTYNINDLDDGFLFVTQLYIKRKQFSYEQEIRVIINKDISDDIITIPIDPNIIFDEIELDPFISSSTFKHKEREIKASGYLGSVTHSKLYNKPFFIFKIK